MSIRVKQRDSYAPTLATMTLRYVSSEDETVADRVFAIRKSLPPKEGRRSRIGYLSGDDLAELLGVARTRVIAWESGDKFPDPANREKLAGLSGGRYSPDDFRRPPPTQERDRWQAGVERRLEELAGLVDEGFARMEEGIARVERRLADVSGREQGSS